jgi:steroid 5-alpha reductase family enzyme
MLLLLGWAGVAAAMLLLWAIQLRTRNASFVDVAWTFGLGATAVWYAIGSVGFPFRRWIVAGLVAAWSLRLGTYLLGRLWHAEEDGRYQRLRTGWGPRANAFFFWFFQAQALLVLIFALPYLAAIRNPTPALTLLDWLGVLLFVGSILGEGLADAQLGRFRADPSNRGKTCRAGLWRYSRHPNYFFQWLHWWAYVLLAWGSPIGWLSLVGPALMLYLILFVTGVPYTEEQALKSRGDDYRAYQRSTSAFFPWFPKSEQSEHGRA